MAPIAAIVSCPVWRVGVELWSVRGTQEMADNVPQVHRPGHN